MSSILYVIKIGGNIIDDEEKLFSFLKEFSLIKEKKILIHGGGKLATNIAEQLQIPQQIIEGRRVTDTATLKVIAMVYAGFINKNITALLQSNNCNALGLTGADGNLLQAHKRTSKVLSIGEDLGEVIDYGFVGDIDTVNIRLLNNLLEASITPVIAPITHDTKGQLLNTNADTIAQEISKSLTGSYAVTLIYCFEKNGVLENYEDESSVIAEINAASYKDLKEKQIIHSGMIPKLDNAFAALNNGVEKVIIGKAEELSQLISGTSGTRIANEQ